MNKEEIKSIIRIAFKKGEAWGVTYYTWFTPEKEDTEKRINETINDIFDMFNLAE
jgi:hypothetical protein